MTQQRWDDHYGGHEQLWSGNPNGPLVTEAALLTPGTALDVGCGEGADAIWLAGQGWQVVAADISRVALDRAAAAAARAGSTIAEKVTWMHIDLTEASAGTDAFGLVSVLYFPLRHDSGHTALRSLLKAVAPGGTVLVVGHDPAELGHLPDLDSYYQTAEIADLLDHDWAIQVNETRPRTTPAPPDTHHTNDSVLRASRR